MYVVAVTAEVHCGGVAFAATGFWEWPPFGTVAEMLTEPIQQAFCKGLAKRVDMALHWTIIMRGQSYELTGPEEVTMRILEHGKGLADEERFSWEVRSIETFAPAEDN